MRVTRAKSANSGRIWRSDIFNVFNEDGGIRVEGHLRSLEEASWLAKQGQTAALAQACHLDTQSAKEPYANDFGGTKKEALTVVTISV